MIICNLSVSDMATVDNLFTYKSGAKRIIFILSKFVQFIAICN